MDTIVCMRIQQLLEPIWGKLEAVTGKGGAMGYNHSSQSNQRPDFSTKGASDEEDSSEDIFSAKNSSSHNGSTNIQMTLKKGQMSPIEEESGIISDSMSSASMASTNSRNFQMPEKDFIQEISKQRGQNDLIDVNINQSNLI